MNIVVQDVQIGRGALKVMVKDSIDIQGLKTMIGSKALMDKPSATKNAEVVERILAADCQITAKTNLHELAFGITGINPVFGTAINPQYPDLIPGGSSSGSAAAVAAGLADFTLGTDTGGSIRMPAACCGVYGFKPTFNRVSRQGIHPAMSSLDCVGPFAASVAMIETAMQIIDPSFHALEKLEHTPKLAWLEVNANPTVLNCIQQFLAQANLSATPVKSEWFEPAYDAGMQIINYENWQAYGELTKTGLLGDDIHARLLKSAQTTAQQVKEAEAVKAQFINEIDGLLEKYDAVLLPTLPQIPPKLIDAEHMVALLNLTSLVRPFNLSGHPAISIPLKTSEGQPVGLQIVAKRNSDELLCAIAKYIVDAAQ